MIELYSKDKKYGLLISEKSIKRFKKLCSKMYPNETGGIIIGYYSRGHDFAMVTNVSGPPRDSLFRATSFYRGISGLETKLRRFWWLISKRYYLGEWHFHPNGSSIPSETDKKQMKEISETKDYYCPEPLLVILGGRHESYELRAYIFVGRKMKELMGGNNV